MESDQPPLRTVAMPAAAPPPLGEVVPRDRLREVVADLVEQTGLVPAEQLVLVRSQLRSNGVGEALVNSGLAPSAGVARMLALQHGLPLVDLASAGISADAIAAIPLRVLTRVVALPFRLEERTLHVALADPRNVQAIDELRLASAFELTFAVASRDEIAAELERLTRVSRSLEISEDFAPDDQLTDLTDLEAEDGVSDGPIVRIVNSVIRQAAEDGASDVHFEMQDEALVVRFRVDGVLSEVQRIPKRLAVGVITRVKVLAKLDIAERRRPQDGRISVHDGNAGRLLDLRVATLPTVSGECAVLRLLDKSRKAPSLEELGLLEEMRAALEKVIACPTGALLVTGPTGSGKSTTLYAALTEINRPEINIITIEDPVEYRLAGVSQMQINVRAGVTFQNALRSILRSDPDVIMVGEIRDGETARIAIEAALTGHRVMSTLHTGDAPSALNRLHEMGVEPYLTGASVTAVLAQRLARKLCKNCSEMYTPREDELLAARASPEVAAASDGLVFYRKRGCPRCGQSGYRGRIGIFQLMIMNEELSELAVRGASRDDLERSAIASGMRTLWDDGIAKVAEGLTSIEEIARVTT